jgi:transposase
MAKYNYRAQSFHQVNWTKVVSALSGDRLIVAVDVAKERFFATLMKADQTVLVTVKWDHPHQSRALVDQLMALGASRVEAVMEPSGSYGDAFRALLRRSGALIYRLTPKRVHDAAEVYDGVPSMHDAKAAYVIGRLHLERLSQPWTEPSERRRQWQAQTKQLEHARERAQRASNRLEALMARHWPEVPYCLGLGTVSLLTLLATYGCPSAVAQKPERARQQLRTTGGHFLRTDKIEAVITSAQTTLGLECVDAERDLIRQLAEEVLQARRQCQQLEKALAREVGQAAGVAEQGEAVGKPTAAVLYCALGEASAYPNAASFEKAAGLNLKERSSGKHQGQLKITKRGPGVARQYLYMAVLRLISRAGPAKHWYEAKVAHNGGHKGKAIVALMRKLIRALWHLGHGEAFDEAKLFGQCDYKQAA